MGTKQSSYGSPPQGQTVPGDHHAPGTLPHYSITPPLRPQVPVPGYDASMMDAPNQVINVALQPTDPGCGCTPGNCSCGPECGCMCCYGNGPGGKTTIIQYNEKGILEHGIHHVIGMSTQAALHGMHDSYAQGIYNHRPTPYGLED